MKNIIITVAPDGTVKIEGVGFTGRTCDEKMAIFEKEMGQVKQRTNKPDYYIQTETTKAVVTQKA